MATVYAIAQAALRAQPSALPEPTERHGRMRVLYDKYTLSADLASGTIINFGVLPKGARVLEVTIKFADLDGSGGTLDVGWDGGLAGLETANPDGFMEDVDVATAADTIKMSANLANASGLYKKFDDDVNIIVTTDGDTDATSGDIELCVEYVLD